MKNIFSRIESLPITIESWIISIVGIVLLRTFFEQYSSFEPTRFLLIDPPSLFHAVSFYLTATIVLMLVLVIFTKKSIKEISAVSLVGLLLILIGPIIDLIFGGIGGHVQSYLFLPWQELSLQFITFFSKFPTYSVTLGMQVEIVIIIIFSCLYVYKATKNVLKTIGVAIIFYILIFFLVSTPSIVSLLTTPNSEPSTSIIQSIWSSQIIQNNIHPKFSGTKLGLMDIGFNKIMIGINIIIALLASFFLFFLKEKKKLIAIIKNSRPERIAHYLLLFVLGSSLAQTAWFSTWIDVQSYVLALIAVLCAWIFCVCQNDIHDVVIDSISNKNRPLITKELSRKDMEVSSKIFLFLSLICAYASSHYVLFFVCLFLLIYFLYSNPPLRLRQFVIVNSFLVSLACLVITLAGFFLMSADKTIITFPSNVLFGIIIFFTAIANGRDIKDIEGDRADGIMTIPVMLGARKSKLLIAGIICFFFLSIPWFFHTSSLVLPSIIASILSAYFITRKNYKEWKTFVVYLLYLTLIIVSINFA